LSLFCLSQRTLLLLAVDYVAVVNFTWTRGEVFLLFRRGRESSL